MDLIYVFIIILIISLILFIDCRIVDTISHTKDVIMLFILLSFGIINNLGNRLNSNRAYEKRPIIGGVNLIDNITKNTIKKINNEKSIKKIMKIKNDFININFDPVYEYKQIPDNIPYSEKSNIANTNCHLGQRKLLLTEIEFYVKCIDLQSKNSKLVIYPGSAPCEHLPIILDMFPTLKFILVDPNYHSIDKYKFHYIYQNVDVVEKSNLRVFQEQMKVQQNHSKQNILDRQKHQNKTAQLLLKTSFLNEPKKYDVIDTIQSSKNAKVMNDIKKHFLTTRYKTLVVDIIKSKDRVFIIQDYMSINLTHKIKKSIDIWRGDNAGNIDVYCLSDIRTNFLSGINGSPHDIDILWNYALQIIFLKILEPTYSMLKFRPPFFMDKDNNVATESVKLIMDNANDKVLKTGISDTKLHMIKIMCEDFNYVNDKYDLDMIGEYQKGKLLYFHNNFVYIQPWSPIISTETRLFISYENIKRKDWFKYDQKEWENKFYYMRWVRMFAYHDIFYKKIKNCSYLSDYDGCYDCTRELMILGNYLVQKDEFQEPTPDIDIDKIENMLGIRSNKAEIYNLYELINKYTFFDLSKKNYKCSFHGNMCKSNNYIVVNYRYQNYLIGIEVKSDMMDIKSGDIIYVYDIKDFYNKRIKFDKYLHDKFVMNSDLHLVQKKQKIKNIIKV